jgi:hypothetical protein
MWLLQKKFFLLIQLMKRLVIFLLVIFLVKEVISGKAEIISTSLCDPVKESMLNVARRTADTMKLLRNDDLWGGRMTETGFKMLIANNAILEGFNVLNEWQVEGGYVDLVLTKRVDGKVCRIIAELKYIQLGFLRPIHQQFLDIKDDHIRRFRVLNDIANRVLNLTLSEKMELQYRIPEGRYETVKAVLGKADMQLRGYMRAFNTGGIGRLDGEKVKLVLVGIGKSIIIRM